MKKANNLNYKAIVMGASAGGVEIFNRILAQLSQKMLVPIVVVQHIAADSEDSLIKEVNEICSLTVKEAEYNEEIMPGIIYFAPAGYHLYIESNETFSLSVDDRVNYSRPSIDLLFESAARVYKKKLIGIIFSGANHDGAYGLKKVKENGGYAIVQDPETAYSPIMPCAAIAACKVDDILDITSIIDFINELVQGN